MSFTDEVLERLTKLRIFPYVVGAIVVEYWTPIQWDPYPLTEIVLQNDSCPIGLSSDSKYLYITDDTNDGIIRYDPKSQKTEMVLLSLRFPSNYNKPTYKLFRSSAIDIYQNYFIVGDDSHVSIIDFNKKEIISQFTLPCDGLKTDGINIYCSCDHLIIKYSFAGTFIEEMGSGRGYGEYKLSTPRGLTLYKNSLYICDSNNHRIVVWDKRDGNYIMEFGELGSLTEEMSGNFQTPRCIDIYWEIVYVGDENSIQLFSLNGNFIQSLILRGDYNGLLGIKVISDRLYVSEPVYNRILIFGPVEGDSSI